MEIVIDGEFSKGKELMKKRRRSCMAEINKLEKKLEKLKVAPNRELNQLESLRKMLLIYSISKTVPVKHNTGIIVNGKLLQAFMKKLKGFQYTISSNEQSLKLQYGRRYGEWTGELELFDISSYFEGFTDIPKLEVYNFLD